MFFGPPVNPGYDPGLAMIQVKAYQRLFADRELLRIVLSSLIARIPVGINGIGLAVLAQETTASFSIGGMVTASYLTAMGICAPLIGRFVDQRSPRGVVLPLGLAHSLFMLGLVLALTQSWPLLVYLLLAAGAGATYPPVGMIMRAMWRKSSLPSSDKQMGFALEGVIMETVFVAGPLILSLFLVFKFPAGALIFSALCALLGTIVFCRSGALLRWGRVEMVQRHWMGPLKYKAVRSCLYVSFLMGATFGFQELAMIAVSKNAGSEYTVGILFALYSVPSALMGLYYGTRQYRLPLNRQMAIFQSWMAMTCLIMVALPSVASYAVFCFICGLVVGPCITASQLQMGHLTPSEYSTEAFTWSNTLFMCALGGSYWIGGWLTEKFGVGTGMLCATITVIIAAVLSLRVPPVHVRA